MAFMRNRFMIIIEIGMEKIDPLFFFHLQDLNPVDLGIPALIVFLDTCIDTFPAADAAGEIEGITKKCVRQRILDRNRNLFPIIFRIGLLQALYKFVLFFRCHIPEIALK